MRISDWSSDVCSSDLVRYRPSTSKRTAVFVVVDLAAPDVVGRTDVAVVLHALHPLGGSVVAHPHLALQPRYRDLLVLEYELADLAILALFGEIGRAACRERGLQDV